ncbi:MAG: hypothetical protein WDZ63_05160 [Burkholderiales bacterium]
MGSATVNLAQAVAGLMAVEKRIIELADPRGLRGLRFEWNDDIDFGHLLDPVPVTVHKPEGGSVETEFTLQVLARFPASGHAEIDAKITELVETLASSGE